VSCLKTKLHDKIYLKQIIIFGKFLKRELYYHQ